MGKKAKTKSVEQRDLEVLVTELRQGETAEPAVYLRGWWKKMPTSGQGWHANVNYQSAGEASRIKTEEVAYERFRRAVEAVMAHNASIEELLKGWYINSGVVRELVGGRRPVVKAYLEPRAGELEKHHQEYGLRPRIIASRQGWGSR